MMIYDPDAFEKFVEVEGEDYRRFKSASSFGEVSFDAFLKEWKELDSCDLDFRGGLGFSIDVAGNGAIYGNGGYHRYIVRNSGEILFLRAAVAHEKCIERARRAGFRIFAEDLK